MTDDVSELAAELERLDAESLRDMDLLGHREAVAAAAVVWALCPELPSPTTDEPPSTAYPTRPQRTRRAD